jgi:hypothetical protein
MLCRSSAARRSELAHSKRRLSTGCPGQSPSAAEQPRGHLAPPRRDLRLPRWPSEHTQVRNPTFLSVGRVAHATAPQLRQCQRSVTTTTTTTTTMRPRLHWPRQRLRLPLHRRPLRRQGRQQQQRHHRHLAGLDHQLLRGDVSSPWLLMSLDSKKWRLGTSAAGAASVRVPMCACRELAGLWRASLGVVASS